MFLGLDLGTGSAKALVLTEKGATVAEISRPYAVASPQPGWAESAPQDWWQAIVACMHEVPEPIRAAVRAIGLSGQMHGAVFCDDEGVPLRRAVLWPDTRAAGLADALPDDLLERAGNGFNPGMTAAILCWMQQHEPALLQAGAHVMQAKDWLRLRLTGQFATDPSDASATLLSDRQGHWDAQLVAATGWQPAQLNPVVASAATTGALAPAAAKALGLPSGLAVAGGAGDTAAGAFGSGLYHYGDAQLTTGSGAQIVVMSATPPPPAANLNAYCAVQLPSLPGWYAMAAMQNCGLALEWARRLLGLDWPAAYAQAFAPEAQRGRARFVPHLSGERSPWMNPALRASWSGLASDDDAGTLMRAAFQGVAFSIRAGLDALRAHGHVPEQLRLAGGGSVHPAWRSLLADTLGLRLWSAECPNASARGAALLGALVDGMPLDQVRALAPQPVPVQEPVHNEAIQAGYQRYLEHVRNDLR